MRNLLSAILLFTGLSTFGQDRDLAFLYTSRFYNDSVYYSEMEATISTSFINYEFAGFNLSKVLGSKKAGRHVLGYTKKNSTIDMYYFPGSSSKKALVIGGVHGSELSAIEIAQELIRQLAANEKPYYSVIIIPTLFPDNAAVAQKGEKDRVKKNIGRYTSEQHADPNRQMPGLGQPFTMDKPLDAQNRMIEKENMLMLQLIQAYAPERIVALHAIRDKAKAGIFADPRTDCEGKALGFSSDSTLAVLMAGYIERMGGAAPGNYAGGVPTALYHLDPRNAPEGEIQPRNLLGSNHSSKAHGVSLGGWASTAICSEEYSRPAMRILTMEFPGYKRSTEHTDAEERKWHNKQVDLYASSIYNYFLQGFCVEVEKSRSKDSDLARIIP